MKANEDSGAAIYAARAKKKAGGQTLEERVLELEKILGVEQ